MDIQSINQGLEEVTKHAYTIYHNYANAKADFENLEEQKKNVLSAISTMKYDGSEATRRRLGESDTDYKSYIEGLNEARTKLLKTSASVKVLEVKLSCYQSLSKNYLKENL